MERSPPKPGPRGDHSRGEFEALVVDAAERLVREAGPAGVGMRRIAALIGYAPNSIYNAVGDLDTVLRHLNARTQTRLEGHLAALADEPRSPRARLFRIADGLLDFACDEPQLWRLLAGSGPGAESPDRPGVAGALHVFHAALAPLLPPTADHHRAAVTLWASLHGIAGLAGSGRLAASTRDDPRRLGRLLVGAFLDGTASSAASALAS